MKIDFENQFHKDLYPHVYCKNYTQTAETWKLFLRSYPQYRKYGRQWLKSRRLGANPLTLQLPWITYASIEFLSSTAGRVDNVFEWGMGGSTLFLAKRCRKVISVEHNSRWFEMVRAAIMKNLTGFALTRAKRRFWKQVSPELHLVKGELCGDGAIPGSGSGSHGYEDIDFSKYVNFMDQYPLDYFDFILVDGRARMDCFEKAIPHCRPGGYIVLDNSDYDRYKDRLRGIGMNKLKGWTKVEYLGPGPCAMVIGWRTTVYQKP